MRNILLDAIYLPLETYFSPRNLRLRTADLLASLPSHRTPIGALFDRLPGTAKIRRWWLTLVLSITLIPALVALIAAVITGAPSFIYPIGFSAGMTWLMVILFALKTGMPAHLQEVPIIVGMGIQMGCAVAILLCIFTAGAGSTDPGKVAAFVDSPAGKLANAVVLGTAIGIFIRILAGAYADNMRTIMLVGMIFLVPFTIGMALFSAPAVLQTNRLSAICAMLGFTGWFILPLELVFSLVMGMMIRANPDSAPGLWRYAPFNWDDFLLPPMPGTVELVVALYRHDRMAYMKTMNRLKQHAFQSALLAKIEDAIAS